MIINYNFKWYIYLEEGVLKLNNLSCKLINSLNAIF